MHACHTHPHTAPTHMHPHTQRITHSTRAHTHMHTALLCHYMSVLWLKVACSVTLLEELTVPELELEL